MQLRRNPLTVLVLLAVVLRPALAATPLQSIRAVPDVSVTLDGTAVLAGRVAKDDLAGTVSLVPIAGIADGEHIDAYHLLLNGDQLLSFDVTVGLPGGVEARPADIIRLSGGTFSREVNANDYGIPEGVNVDAVSVENGNLLVSFDTTVSLGELIANKADVVSFNGSTVSLRFDASAAGIAAGLDVDAVDSVGGHLLLSFDGSGSVGGVVFNNEDVLEYDGANWELVYDGSDRHSALAGANLTGLSAEVVPPTATPTATSTQTPSTTPTSEPTNTPTVTPVPTDLPTLTPTQTNVPTNSPTVTPTNTLEPTSSPTPTLTPSGTRVPSTTPTETAPASPTATATAILTATPTSTVPPSASATPISSATTPPTASVTSTATPTSTLQPSTSATPTSSATTAPTASVTPTVTLPAPSATGTLAATATTTTTPTASPTGGTPACIGDCGGDGEVTVDELVLLVNIALDLQPTSACVAGDANHDGQITIEEILIAVNRTLTGC